MLKNCSLGKLSMKILKIKAFSDEPSKYAQKTSKKVIATAFLFERGQKQRKHAIY